MPKLARAAAFAAAVLALVSPAGAAIGDDYAPGRAPVTSTWHIPANPAARQADRDYIAGMRPHHAGALTMSRDYLADPAARSPALRALAQAIIRNQDYEIGLLDDVSRNLDQPARVLDLGILRLALQPAATEGLGQTQRFLRSPIPGPLTRVGPVSERDVQFAKGMIIHHEAALEMARAYHANPAARNGFLHLMNTDIITDQSQEIALMRRAIAAYPGDAAAVVVDPSTIHGMEGMRHGGAGHAGHGAAPAAEPPGRMVAEPHGKMVAEPHGGMAAEPPGSMMAEPPAAPQAGKPLARRPKHAVRPAAAAHHHAGHAH